MNYEYLNNAVAYQMVVSQGVIKGFDKWDLHDPETGMSIAHKWILDGKPMSALPDEALAITDGKGISVGELALAMQPEDPVERRERVAKVKMEDRVEGVAGMRNITSSSVREKLGRQTDLSLVVAMGGGSKEPNISISKPAYDGPGV